MRCARTGPAQLSECQKLPKKRRSLPRSLTLEPVFSVMSTVNSPALPAPHRELSDRGLRAARRARLRIPSPCGTPVANALLAGRSIWPLQHRRTSRCETVSKFGAGEKSPPGHCRNLGRLENAIFLSKRPVCQLALVELDLLGL